MIRDEANVYIGATDPGTVSLVDASSPVLLFETLLKCINWWRIF